ncbi:MAG TPA: hypothetical protein DIT58_09215 [Porticoccaceae bacterium]|nr:hypothetical protein [Porticoccaceae bacterium]
MNAVIKILFAVATRRGLILSLVFGLAATPVLAEHERERDRNRTLKHAVAEIILSEVLFGDHDRRVLKDYLRGEQWTPPGQRGKKLPPGLRKKLERGGELPPGWQKKLQRWEVLDDDVYRHSRRLPDAVLDDLLHQPEGTSIRRIEDRVVRILDATRTVLDVLYLVDHHR